MNHDIEHDAQMKRFLLRTPNGIATLDYEQVDGHTLEFKRTFVPEADRGGDIGDRIVEHAFEFASEHERTVIPTCPFVRSWLERHPGFQPLVALAAPREGPRTTRG